MSDTDPNQPTAEEVKVKWAAAITALVTAFTTLGRFCYGVYRRWRARQAAKKQQQQQNQQQNQQPPDSSGQ